MAGLNDMGEFVDDPPKTMKLAKHAWNGAGGFSEMPYPRPTKAGMPAIVEEFAKSDAVCIGKKYGDREELKRDYWRAKQATRNRDDGVKATKRGNTLYLVKEW